MDEWWQLKQMSKERFKKKTCQTGKARFSNDFRTVSGRLSAEFETLFQILLQLLIKFSLNDPDTRTIFSSLKMRIESASYRKPGYASSAGSR